MTQAASPPHKMLSISAVFARCTKCLSTRWAMAATSRIAPTRYTLINARLSAPPSLRRQSWVADRAWLARSFTGRLRDAVASKERDADQREKREERYRKHCERDAPRHIGEVGQSERARDQRDKQKNCR